MAAAFDTLAAARDMENAGLPREAAEAVAGAIRAGQGELATKADLDALQSATRADLDALQSATRADLDVLRNATRAELAAVEARMTWRIVLALAAQAGLIVALLKWLP